jgi:transposase
MRTTAALLEDICGISISVGGVAASCARLSAVLAPIDATIQNQVQQQPQLWVDETSWREGRVRGWLWLALSPQATCLRIHASRGQGALWQLLGEEYAGVVHSDRASVYHALPDRQRQLCWAHLIRNLQGLADYEHAESRWARALLGWTQPLFEAWRAYQCGVFDQIALQQALIPVRVAMHELLMQGARQPWEKLQATCTDLLRHWEALWTFSRVEGLEPTNNRAERALRPAVIWRKSCYGTQSETGSRFVERMLSVQATCAQQRRSLFAFLTEAVRAAWALQPVPVLISTS